MKRLFIIIAAVIVVIGILVLVYFKFLKKPAAVQVGTNPFSAAQSGDAAPSPDLPTSGTLQNAGTALAPRFIKITDGPVSRGTVSFVAQPQQAAVASTSVVSLNGTSTASTSLKAGSSTPAVPQQTQTTSSPDIEVRFIDRASGNVYSYLARARTLTRISNKTLPGIQIASWVPDGSKAFVQFLAASAGAEQVNTYALTANGGDGYLLENNLSQAVVAGSSTLFTLYTGSTGSVGTVSNIDGSNSRTLFSSVLSALTVHATSGDLFATTKPSSQIDGYAFQINRKTGVFSRMLGPFRGLSVLPNANGSSLLYSYTDAGVYRLRVLTVANRQSVGLPVATVTEKCTWASNSQAIYCAIPTNLEGDIPDAWYQGSKVFTDRIWRIDLQSRVASLVLDPSQIGNSNIDAVNLTVDPNEDFLVFMDKHTGALYAYDL
jgi:hypothetical protein